MAEIIGSVKHAPLISLQRKVFTAFAELDAYDGEDREAMQEKVS